jgi:hypothetical protein
LARRSRAICPGRSLFVARADECEGRRRGRRGDHHVRSSSESDCRMCCDHGTRAVQHVTGGCGIAT